MLRQYYAPRGRPAAPCAQGRGGLVGTMPAGTFFRFPRRGLSGLFVLHRIEGWIPREYPAARKDAAGQWQSTRMAGGHLAIVRCLADNTVRTLADHHIARAVDA